MSVPAVRATMLAVSASLTCALANAPATEPLLRTEPIRQEREVIDIGTRLEPFVDRHLIATMTDVAHRLTAPERREVVLVLDRPWEGPASAYYTVFRDGGKIRLYYRGHCPNDLAEAQVTCYAESNDGIAFSRPNLRMFEFEGSKDNNIVYRGVAAHNFAPFRDSNPNSKPGERYKAVAGVDGKLWAFAASDGLRWHKMVEDPVLTKGAFDSLNIAFWDSHAKLYRCYSRSWSSGNYAGIRSIQSATSADFLHWTEPQPNTYEPPEPREHFYTNATIPYPGAEHLLLSFPKRFVPDRTKLPGYTEGGVSDAVLMSSRDGVHWDRPFLEAWVRPGLDQRNWTQRSNMPAWGMLADRAEFSWYVSEHYDWPDNRLRRITVPRDRMASIHAGARRGEFTTHPIQFEGADLVVNYSTSAAGSIAVEIQALDGTPIPGYASADMEPLFGDELAAPIRWKQHRAGELARRPVRLRVILRDADIYSLQFTSPDRQ